MSLCEDIKALGVRSSTTYARCSGVFVPGDALRSRDLYVKYYNFASENHMEAPCAHHIIFDGARLSFPAQEYLLSIGETPQNKIGAWGPPLAKHF